MIMLGSGKDDEFWPQLQVARELGGVETCSLYIVVPDADAAYARAGSAGAVITTPLHDTPMGAATSP